MATKGTYAAYQQLRGTGDSIGPVLQHADRMGMYRRQEERMREKAERERKSALAKERGLDLSEMHVDSTGIKSLDNPVYKYVQEQTDNLLDYYERLEENPDDTDAKIMIEKIMHNVDELKRFAEEWSVWNAKRIKGLEDGTYDEYLNQGVIPEINKAFLNGQYKILTDKNGRLDIFVDLDKDGIQDSDFQMISPQGFFNGTERPELYERTDRYAAQDVIAERYGTLETITDSTGYRTVEYKGFDPSNIGALRRDVNELFGDSKENMTREGMSIIYNHLGIDPKEMTEEQFKEYKTKFGDGILNKFDTRHKNDVSPRSGGSGGTGKGDGKDGNPIAFVENKEGDKSSFALKTPYTIQSKNDNQNPGSITEVELIGDDIVLKGQTLLRKETTKPNEFSEDNTTKSRDVYAPLVLDSRDGQKERITGILSERTGLNSYDEIVSYLKGLSGEEEAETTTNSGFDPTKF